MSSQFLFASNRGQEPPSPADHRYFRVVAAICLAGFLLHLAYAIAEWRFLFGDGVNFFVQILAHGEHFEGNRPTRLMAVLITQAPLLAGLRAGITDLDVLAVLYGLGLYFPYILCMAVWVVVTRHRPELLVFPLAFLFASAANSQFFIITESHTAAALFFTLVPLVVLVPRWNAGTVALGSALMVASLYAYTTDILYGPLLAALAAWRASCAESKLARAGWVAAVLVFIAGAVISLLDIVTPAETKMSAEPFIQHALAMAWHHTFAIFAGSIVNLHHGALLSIFALLAIALLLVPFRATQGPGIAGWTVSLYGLACLAVLLTLVAFPVRLEVPLHYRARVLQLVLPPLFAVALFGIAHWKWSVPAPRLRAAFAVVLALALFQNGWHVLATHQWSGYLDVFRVELAANSGYLRIQDSALSERRRGRQVIEKMNWGWTLPSTSIVLAPEGRVRTIVGDPGRDRPYDPREPGSLPDLSRYGVDYSGYVAALRLQVACSPESLRAPGAEAAPVPADGLDERCTR